MCVLSSGLFPANPVDGHFLSLCLLGALAPDPISGLRGPGLGWQRGMGTSLAQPNGRKEKKGARVARPPQAQAGEQASPLALTVHLPLEGAVGICLVEENGGPGQAEDTRDSPEVRNSGASGGTASCGQSWRRKGWPGASL